MYRLELLKLPKGSTPKKATQDYAGANNGDIQPSGSQVGCKQEQMHNKIIKGERCVVAEQVSSEGGQGTTTRNAEVQGQPGLIKIREGRAPSNKATTRAKYDEAQTLGHSSTSAGRGKGLPKASSDPTRVSETEVHSSVRLFPFPRVGRANRHPEIGHGQGRAMHPKASLQ